MTMRHLSACVLAMLAVFVFILGSCSNSDSPTAPGGGGLPQDSLGVLLEGPATDPATTHTITLSPAPADASDITDSLLITNRLDAVIMPGATVGQVNTALTSIGATIVGMSAQLDLLSLRIQAVTTVDEADSLCATLIATGAFAFAFPAYAVATDGLRSQIPVNPDDTGLAHLIFARAPAAWNMRGALAGAPNLTIVIPDSYWGATPDPNQLVPSAEIPHQTFLTVFGKASQGQIDIGGAKVWDGNHGYHVCGTIAAKWDGNGSTGIHPYPELVYLSCMPTGGLSWPAMLLSISQSMPASSPFLVSTSLGYNDPLFAFESKTKRLTLALIWRKLVGNRQSDFLHFTSAGNDGTVLTEGGDALWNSPFCTAKKIGDVTALIPPGTVPEPERQMLITYYQNLVTNSPYTAPALANTIIVGSSDATGQPSVFSSRSPDIRLVGRSVYNICAATDPAYPGDPTACDGARTIISGTSMATPQATGIAAYLLQLAPGTPLNTIKEIILNSYDETTGFTDMYGAVLALDQSFASAPMRETLLDVAGNSDAPGSNLKFDEHDLKVFLDSLDHYDQLHLTSVDDDYSRYDLNGNGITADGGSIGSFDLDINTPPAYTALIAMIQEQERIFLEELLSDREILCYYAYSNLYQGDIAIRDSLMIDCILPYRLFATMADTIVVPGDSMLLSLRLGQVYTPDTLWEQGAEITLTTTDGDAHPESGTTDANGRFLTWLVPSSSATMQAVIVATVGGYQVLNDTLTLKVAPPEWGLGEASGGASSWYEIEDIYLGIVGTNQSDSSGLLEQSATYPSSVSGDYASDNCDVQLASGGSIRSIVSGPFGFSLIATAGDTLTLHSTDSGSYGLCQFTSYVSSDADGYVSVVAVSGSIVVSTSCSINLAVGTSDSGATDAGGYFYVSSFSGSVYHEFALYSTNGLSASTAFVDTISSGDYLEIGGGAYSSSDLYDIGWVEGTYKSSAKCQITVTIAPL